MPELVQLHEAYADDDTVRLLAVSIDLESPRSITTLEGIADFVATRGFTLPVVALQGDLRAFAETFGFSGSIPYTFVLDADGRIVDKQVGGAPLSRFEAMLKKAQGR